MRWRWVAAAVLACLCRAAWADTPRALPLGPPDRWRSVVFDAGGGKVFVAHQSEITVVDPGVDPVSEPGAMRVAAHVSGLVSAHGVAIVPGGHGYASSGRTGTVTVFDPACGAVLGTIRVGQDPNAVAYDSASRRVFVANDDVSTITVIDAARDAAVGTIFLTGGEGMEGAAVDGQGHLYVSHSAQHELVRIDTARAEMDAAWELPDCEKPEGMALHAPWRRLFVGCANARLLAIDIDSGRVVAALPIGPQTAAVLLDAGRGRIYAPSPAGTLSVIAARGPDAFAALPDVPIALGARSGALDTASGMIYLVTADIATSVPSPTPGGAPFLRFAPGTVKLIALPPPE